MEAKMRNTPGINKSEKLKLILKLILRLQRKWYCLSNIAKSRV